MQLKNLHFYLLATLLALLPLHAFGVTFLNYLFFDGTASAPLGLKMWKEGVIFLLFILLALQVLRKKIALQLDVLDYAILAYLGIGFVTAVFLTKDLVQSFFGAKYAFEFLVLFLIVRQFFFEKEAKAKLIKTVVLTASLVIIFGLMQKLILPPDFLIHFGYSLDHSHFSPNKPLAYCQKISGTDECRLQSFLSGPNQLGSYLLVVLPLFLIPFYEKFLKRKKSLWEKVKHLFWKKKRQKKIELSQFLVFGLGVLVLVFAYSRASWLGFALMLLIVLLQFIQKKKQLWMLLGGGAVLILISIFVLKIFAADFFHEVVFRPSSTQGHFERMADGVKFSLQNPFGLGLGNAGPASNHFSKDYLGFIPESWYLQVSLEMGILGIIIYLLILGLVLKKLWSLYQKEERVAFALFLSLMGLMVSSFFLHTWEDSSTALIFWGLLGVILSKEKKI